jgi:hypothetical protein
MATEPLRLTLEPDPPVTVDAHGDHVWVHLTPHQADAIARVLSREGFPNYGDSAVVRALVRALLRRPVAAHTEPTRCET